MGAPGFWDEPETAQKTAQAVTQLKEEVETFRSLETRVEDMEVLCELALEEDDESLLPEMEETLVSIRTDVEHLELGMLLNGEYDANNAILTLHAGAGGTEAQDWTSMLLRMFSRFAEREGYEVEMLDYLPGDEAGVKSATLQINGHNAYGYLRSEKGVHRLVRISPFDANARRHTSFAAVDVMPELDDSVAIDINPADLKVDTYRASGAGGQHVNKTSSAVRKQDALKSDIAGDYQDIEWGSQIRSYVFQPYKLVKDHRTNAETGNVQAVMDGGLEMFVEAYLRSQQKKL